MKTFFKLLFVSVLFASCGDADTAVYDGNGQTFLSFSSEIYTLPIAIGDTGSVDVILNSSSKSSVDRTYPVTIISEETTADPATYSLPATVTIPANSHQGTLTITGQDVGMSTEDPRVLVIEFGAEAGDAFDSNRALVNVRVVCPVETTAFVGQYLIEEQTPYVDGPTLDDGGIVTLELDPANGELARKFQTRNYPDYCSPFMTFGFSLVCNEVIVNSNQRSTCACSSAGLFFGPATTPGTYDSEDDTVFYVTFTNDVTGDCSSASQTTYKFTKQ